MSDPTAYQLDYACGQAAKRADQPFDHLESPGWVIGYGDAVLIEPVAEAPGRDMSGEPPQEEPSHGSVTPA